MTQLARDTGLSRESLYKSRSGERRPSSDTLFNREWRVRWQHAKVTMPMRARWRHQGGDAGYQLQRCEVKCVCVCANWRRPWPPSARA